MNRLTVDWLNILNDFLLSIKSGKQNLILTNSININLLIVSLETLKVRKKL